MHTAPLSLWHSCLGHLSFNKLKFLFSYSSLGKISHVNISNYMECRLQQIALPYNRRSYLCPVWFNPHWHWGLLHSPLKVDLYIMGMFGNHTPRYFCSKMHKYFAFRYFAMPYHQIFGSSKNQNTQKLGILKADPLHPFSKYLPRYWGNDIITNRPWEYIYHF